MSKLRPTLVDACGEPCLGYQATYFRVLDAVARRRALIHGRLEDKHGGTCAVGCYFREARVALPSKAIDEIAAYNDSFPHLCPEQRWRKVVAWLRFQVKAMKAGTPQ